TGVVTAATPPALAPVVTSLPAVSGTAEDGSTLTASTGVWSGTAPLAFTYQWRRCNAAGVSCVAVAGATGDPLVLGAEDVGARVQVLVTATNAAGSASVASPPTQPVAAAPPASTAAPTIDGTPLAGSELTATAGTWTGTAPLGLAYAWQ